MTDNRAQSRIHSNALVESRALVGQRNTLSECVERIQRRCRIVIVRRIYCRRSVYNVSVRGRSNQHSFACRRGKLENDGVDVLSLGIVKHKIVASSVRRIEMLRACHIVYARSVRAGTVYDVFRAILPVVCLDYILSVLILDCDDFFSSKISAPFVTALSAYAIQS